jgi:hypothetical protein
VAACGVRPDASADSDSFGLLAILAVPPSWPARGDCGRTCLARRVEPVPGTSIERDLKNEITKWAQHPFMPHLIARMRPSAYQWYTFFAYLDVLIGWADQEFRRDTRESVAEATLLYVLAAKLLGPRPRVIPPPAPPPAPNVPLPTRT